MTIHFTHIQNMLFNFKTKQKVTGKKCNNSNNINNNNNEGRRARTHTHIHTEVMKMKWL